MWSFAGLGRLLPAAGLLLMVVALSPRAHGQISPGPLSKAHSSLDGPLGCVKCHQVSATAGSPRFRCLECHQDIASRLRQRRGLHASFMSAAGTSEESCARCHSEHNGANFSIVHWDPSPGKFDHSKTGFILEGKHADLACNKCHNSQRISAGERATINARDLNRTYLGLSRTCTTCHEDKHRGQLGTNCAQCHNAVDWKAAREFDHSKTRFVLTGAHREVKCEKCHTTSAAGVEKFAIQNFQSCSTCHSDVHRGAFKQTCQSCHNTVRWKQTTFAARFDHSKTKFPLAGKHLELGCTTCHRGGDFKTAIAHDFCADCHRPDPHGGQFLARKDRGACESCHTVQGFKPAKFGLAEHNATGYPLREAHATLACAKCHIPAGKATIYKLKFAACLDCHKDVHQNQFAGAPHWNRCEQCHTETTFHPSKITLVKHKEIFPLTGSHLAVACIDCHKPAGGMRVALYRFDKLSCTTCHNDPHRGQFAAGMSKLGDDGKPLSCAECHTTGQWNELHKFDHRRTRFVLTGAHRALECAECHRPPNLERTLKNVNFTAAPTACEDCHQDPHGGQFAGVGGITTCARCHNTMNWRPSLFDHDKTLFSLRGGHQDVRCAACHINLKSVDGKQVLFYKPTPVSCSACHGNKVAAQDVPPTSTEGRTAR